MVVPELPPEDRQSQDRSGRRWGLVVAASMAALLIGWLFGFTGDSQDTSAPTQLNPIPSDPTTPQGPEPATSSSVPARGDAEPTGRVQPLPGAASLRGSIALTTPGPLAHQNLWVIRPGGRIVQRVDAPAIESGRRHPLMIVGDHVVLTNDDGTFSVSVDLEEPARRVADPGLLIPDAGDSRVWLVGRDVTKWFAPVEGATGDVGNRTGLPEGFRWPFTGYDDGILFQPENVSAYGLVAYWPAGGTPEPLGVDFDRQSGLRSVVGHQAAVVTSGPTVTVLDLQTRQEAAVITFNPEGGIAVEACLNEDGRHLAIISSSGKVEIFDTATGASRFRVSTVDPPWSVGWSAPDQLIYIGPGESSTGLSLESLDLSSGQTTSIATLEDSETWRIATSSRPC